MSNFDETVTIFFPTYRNVEVFRFSLETVLNQSYSKLFVKVFDNSFADGYSEIYELIQQTNDSRVYYSANPENVGPKHNYFQIFQHASRTPLSVVLAADTGLHKDALTMMVAAIQQEDVAWVRPQSKGYSTECIPQALKFSRTSLAANAKLIEAVHSLEVLSRFFSPENIDGEFDTASWAGSLIRAEVWESAQIGSVPFQWHGLEQYITMRLLQSNFYVAMIGSPLEVALVGAPRFGTERPTSDYTRLETILAGYRIVREQRNGSGDCTAVLQVNHLISAVTRFLRVRRGHRFAAIRLMVSLHIFRRRLVLTSRLPFTRLHGRESRNQA